MSFDSDPRYSYLNNPIVYKNFLSEKERDSLFDIAMTKYNEGWFKADEWFTKNYRNQLPDDKHYRHILHISSYSFITNNPPLEQIYKRIVDRMGLSAFKSYAIDPMIGQIVSITMPGGFTQKHTDKYEKNTPNLAQYYVNKRHARFNIMVNRGSNDSYLPFIMTGKGVSSALAVGIGDAWCFPADKNVHFSPPLKGEEMRIVYQFGFAIDTTPKV